MLVLAFALSLLIGLSLGLLGGGGSIFTVAILVYGLHVEAKSAIATSLLVVGITSIAALVPHALAGRVRFRTGVVFGAAGMIGAYVAGRLAHYIPPAVLLLLFALMMLVTAAAMLRGPKSTGAEDKNEQERARPLFKILLQGLAVGAITGLVGAGGGFLVVPALVLLGGLPMSAATGTSLVVIAMNSLAGLSGYLGHVAIDSKLATIVSVSAVIGSLLGARLAVRIPQARLRKGFAWLVIAMGLFMLAQQLPRVLGVTLSSRAVLSYGLPLALGLVLVPAACRLGQRSCRRAKESPRVLQDSAPEIHTQAREVGGVPPAANPS